MRRLAILLGIVIAVALVRVAATHHLLAAVADEPAHVAAGYDWLTGHGYSTDPTHPPLARILSALPLVLAHVPEPHYTFVARGNDLLYSNDRYDKNVARTRLGNLLFFALAILGTAALGARYYGVAHEQLANGIALLSGQGPTPATVANCPVYTDVSAATVGGEEQVAGDRCSRR